jgi:SAM-dependent methyltransferase
MALASEVRPSPAGPEGERVDPRDPAQNLVFQGHRAVHEYGHRHLARGRVLDLGCGEGYGSDWLAQRSRICVAADRDLASVGHAAARYHREGLHFVVADAAALPFASRAFGAVWSVEVIEHLPEVEPCLAEVTRVLADGGLYFLSTPNRPVFSRDGKINAFHFREYDAGELERLLASRFPKVRVVGLFLTNFLSARGRWLARLSLAMNRTGLDRLVPVAGLRRIFRRAFRRQLDTGEWNERNRVEHWQVAPLGAVGGEHAIDLVALCRK